MIWEIVVFAHALVAVFLLLGQQFRILELKARNRYLQQRCDLLIEAELRAEVVCEAAATLIELFEHAHYDAPSMRYWIDVKSVEHIDKAHVREFIKAKLRRRG